MEVKDHAALIIWWCEGTKARRDYRWKDAYLYPVELTNTNPKIIKIFLNFLRNKFEVPNIKLKGQLQIHEGDNQTELEQFWSEETNIPLSQFNKTIVRPKGNKQFKTKGTFKVRFYDKKTYLQLESLLEQTLIFFGA